MTTKRPYTLSETKGLILGLARISQDRLQPQILLYQNSQQCAIQSSDSLEARVAKYMSVRK